MLRTRMVLLLLVFISLMTREALSAAQDCMEIPTETHWTQDQMEGTWYPMEIVLHRNDSKIYGVPIDSDCPVVTFTKGKGKQLHMVWNTTNGDVKFTFQQKNARANAQWQSLPEQTGRTATAKMAILDLEAERYMVARLCSNTTHNTILLSRQSTRPEADLTEANNKLTELVKFPVHERKPMCMNSATMLDKYISLVLTFVVLLLRQ